MMLATLVYVQVQVKTEAINEMSWEDIFCGIKFCFILLRYMGWPRGQITEIMGLYNLIMKLHNSVYGAL